MFFTVALQSRLDLGCLGVEVYRSQKIRHTHTHTLGHPWMSDQLVAEAAADKNIKHNKITYTYALSEFQTPGYLEQSGSRPTP
jgi:hypothetical protein